MVFSIRAEYSRKCQRNATFAPHGSVDITKFRLEAIKSKPTFALDGAFEWIDL